MQRPAWQVSDRVHELASLQLVPFGAAGFEQTPLEGLHVPATWHGPLAAQTTALPPHVPDWQVSPLVQRLPSLQAVPFGTAGFEHCPVEGLQVPATWHGSLAAQTTALPPHVPD